MGLIDAFATAAAARPHVLVAEAPGAFRQRVAVERAAYAAGWCLTDTIADADVLAVVGEPRPQLMAVVDHAWEQMSEPRARTEVHDEDDVPSALVEAREVLLATGEQRMRARQRRSSQELLWHDSWRAHGDSHERHDPDHGGHDHGGDEEGGHDHGDMSPDGIPLAEGAADRDGLEMDELHLPLGPLLAHWPAGVVLRLTLHGDVVAGAEVEDLAAADGASTGDDGPVRAARLLDAVTSVLTVAGLPGESARARRLRDRCLDDTPLAPDTFEEFAMRVRRHRALRWLLSGLVLPATTEGASSCMSTWSTWSTGPVTRSTMARRRPTGRVRRWRLCPA